MRIAAAYGLAAVVIVVLTVAWIARQLLLGAADDPTLVLVTGAALGIGMVSMVVGDLYFRLLLPLARAERAARSIDADPPPDVLGLEQPGATRELAAALEALRLRRVVAERDLSDKIDGATAELRRSNRELEEFAQTASHDLREPARTIGSYLEIIEDGVGEDVSPDDRRAISHARDAADRMLALLDGLLQVSRVQTQPLDVEDVPLDLVMAQVEANLEAALSQAEASLVWRDLPTVRGTESQLIQLFQNLVANSIKYARPEVPPEIVVRGEMAADALRVRVEDNGIGIDPQLRDRVFLPFRQLHRRGDYEGIGIGLTIVKRIVERFRARIAIVEREPPGATFVIDFPRERAPEPTPEKLPDEALIERVKELA